MERKEGFIRTRRDLHCLAIPPEIWSMARERAKEEQRSISSLVRSVIVRECKKGRRKELTEIN